MPDYKKVVEFFDEYIAHYREFLDFEYKKLDMLNKDEIEKLSSSLSYEQAFIMKTNTLEKKRLKVLEEDADKTFAELAETAPKEYGVRLSEQHRELSGLILKIKEINDLANIIVSERLKKIQRRTGEVNVYDGKGTVKHEQAVRRTAILKNV